MSNTPVEGPTMKDPLRGHKGDSFLDAGMWVLTDDEPIFIPPTERSVVDQLADIVR